MGSGHILVTKLPKGSKTRPLFQDVSPRCGFPGCISFSAMPEPARLEDREKTKRNRLREDARRRTAGRGCVSHLRIGLLGGEAPSGWGRLRRPYPVTGSRLGHRRAPRPLRVAAGDWRCPRPALRSSRPRAAPAVLRQLPHSDERPRSL